MTAGRLVLPEHLLDRMTDRAQASFPDEACGVLLGPRAAGTSPGPDSGMERVVDVVPCENRAEDPGLRYEIAPEDLFAVQKRARAEGLRLLGYWHSHPNGRPRPSDDDRRHAFPGVSWVIVPVDGGRPRRPTAWRFDRSDGTFHEQDLEIEPSDTGNSTTS